MSAGYIFDVVLMLLQQFRTINHRRILLGALPRNNEELQTLQEVDL